MPLVRLAGGYSKRRSLIHKTKYWQAGGLQQDLHASSSSFHLQLENAFQFFSYTSLLSIKQPTHPFRSIFSQWSLYCHHILHGHSLFSVLQPILKRGNCSLPTAPSVGTIHNTMSYWTLCHLFVSGYYTKWMLHCHWVPSTLPPLLLTICFLLKTVTE